MTDDAAALNAALELTTQAFACFPLGRDKCPAIPKKEGGNGFKDATTDQHSLRAMWARHPGPLVGVATGAISGIDVLDIDQKPEGRAWWADNRSRIPSTRTHRTRSGGLHILFQHASGLRSSAGRIHVGVDTRADGGYVVWWPAAGLPVLSDAPIAPWADWLLAQAMPPAPTAPLAPAAVVSDGKLLRGILTIVTSAAEGSRNNCLHWAACRFAETTLDRSDATALLLEAAAQVGLPVTEARATIDSAYRRLARGG